MQDLGLSVFTGLEYGFGDVKCILPRVCVSA